MLSTACDHHGTSNRKQRQLELTALDISRFNLDPLLVKNDDNIFAHNIMYKYVPTFQNVKAC